MLGELLVMLTCKRRPQFVKLFEIVGMQNVPSRSGDPVGVCEPSAEIGALPPHCGWAGWQSSQRVDLFQLVGTTLISRPLRAAFVIHAVYADHRRSGS